MSFRAIENLIKADIRQLHLHYSDVERDIPIITSSNTSKTGTLASTAMRVKITYNNLCDYYCEGKCIDLCVEYGYSQKDGLEKRAMTKIIIKRLKYKRILN